MTKRKSMRGKDVDVGLIRMKQQLMDGKKTEPNIKREDYVSDRRRRSSSKRIDEMFANEQIVRQKLVDQKKVEGQSHEIVTEVIGVTEAAILAEMVPDETSENAASPKGRTIHKKQG
jgi:hypothetical protein